jgi:hypothetical protein
MEPQEEGSHDTGGLEGSPTACVGKTASFAWAFGMKVLAVRASIPQHERKQPEPEVHIRSHATESSCRPRGKAMTKKENWEEKLRETFYQDRIAAEHGVEAVKLRRLHISCRKVFSKYRVVLVLYSAALFALTYGLFEIWGGMACLVITLGIGASVYSAEGKVDREFLEEYDPNWFMPD